MATYRWRASNSGTFDNPANWDLAALPGAGDTAVLAAYGGTISGTGSVGALVFGGGANWVVAGQIAGAAASIDLSAVDADGQGQVTVNGPLSVGLAAAAALTASRGGAVVVTGGNPAAFGAATLTVNTRGIIDFNGLTTLGRNGAATAATVDAGVLAIGSVLQLGASAGGSATLLVQDSGEALVGGGPDQSTTYLQVGAVAGSTGTVQVTGPASLLIVSSNSGAVGVGGVGTLNVTAGGLAQFNTSNNGQNPALVIGQYGGAQGTVGVGGTGSQLSVNGSVLVGVAGSGTLRVVGGATATSTTIAGGQAALSLGAGVSGGGTLVIDGAGSQYTAYGAAIVGGDNRGTGLIAGGTGSIAVTGGGVLQTGAMTILPTSLVTLDGASQVGIGGDLVIDGAVKSFGTLSVAGAVAGPGALQIGGGLASIGALSNAMVAFTSASGSLRVSALAGQSSVTGLQSGEAIDLVSSNATISGNTVSTATGSLVLGPPVADTRYVLSSDGAGGTFVTLGAATVGVYRFFDTHYGTHFFSASTAEKDLIAATRPDLVFEGVGLESIDPASGDPHAAAVYRFFDTNYGTHFFTASTAERDAVIATRPDLLYEGVGFTEHTAQQTGDVGVYRFFDSTYGTHFYTAVASERTLIEQTRPDLIEEGIGFYAPGS